MSDWADFYIRCDTAPVWPEGEEDGGPQVPWNWLPVSAAPLHYMMAERPDFDEETGDPKPAKIMSDPAVIAAGGYQIGGWVNGEKHGPVDEDAYEAMRGTFGNFPAQPIYDEEGNQIGEIPVGQATVHLRASMFAGAPQCQLGEPSDDLIMTLYPIDRAPYAIEMRFKDFGGTIGWRCEVVGGVESRDIASRQMRGTGGGAAFPFVKRDSEWYQDEEGYLDEEGYQDEKGNPVQTWSSENDEGWTEETDHELAMRYQGKTEGWWGMAAGTESETKLFWAKNQS